MRVMNHWQKSLNAWASKPFVRQLQARFPRAEIFLVGGAVRDAILGRPTQDVDFVVRNVGKAPLERFLAQHGTVNLVGKRFGVFKFKPTGLSAYDLDIALPRTEHSLQHSGAYRDFKISSNSALPIEQDLSRRDFTVNAMAWDLYGRRLVDPFGGMADLKKKIIRTVGAPRQRFGEDYSRLLRAIRFAGQLGFTIDKQTWSALRADIKKLNRTAGGERIVPFEVIAKELVKMFDADPIEALTRLDRSGALQLLMPELLKMKGCPQPRNWHAEGDVWKHTRLALRHLTSASFRREFGATRIPSAVIWGLVFHDVGKPFTISRSDRLRFNNHDGVSTALFKKTATRLKLSSAGLDVEATGAIIARHMLLVHGQADKMKATTVEKYFFSDRFPGQLLLRLMFADISATVPPSGKPDFSDYRRLTRRLARLTKRSPGKRALPQPILDGHELMRHLRLPAGPKIGELLLLLREAQLRGTIKTKKQALALLKKRR